MQSATLIAEKLLWMRKTALVMPFFIYLSFETLRCVYEYNYFFLGGSEYNRIELIYNQERFHHNLIICFSRSLSTNKYTSSKAPTPHPSSHSEISSNNCSRTAPQGFTSPISMKKEIRSRWQLTTITNFCCRVVTKILRFTFGKI